MSTNFHKVYLGISAAAAGLILSAVSTFALGAEGAASALYVPNDAFFATAGADQMTEDGLKAAADDWAKKGESILLLCPNGQKANFKNKVREEIWADVDHKTPSHPWPQNAMRLDAAGIDPYQVWIAEAREKKIAPWICMTMNDISGALDWTDFRNSTFWVHRPHYWIIGSCDLYRLKQPSDRALVYSADQVWNHNMDFVKLLLERYDMDGLTLDWSINGHFLDYGTEKARASILTRFVEEAKKEAAAASVRWKHPVKLAVRVTGTPKASEDAGVNAAEWAKSGLIDALIPTATEQSEGKVDAAAWKKALDGTDVEIWQEKSL